MPYHQNWDCFRLIRTPMHTLLFLLEEWNFSFSMSDYVIQIFLEKWLNHLQTMETLIRCCTLWHLIWVCTICHIPFGSLVCLCWDFTAQSTHYCAFNIFQKVFFLLGALHRRSNFANFWDRFSPSSACSIFLKFSQCCCETSIIQIQQRKRKNIFWEKKLKNHFTIEIAWVRPIYGH